MPGNKIKTITFGCRLNLYESAIIDSIDENNDIIVFNTCAVTSEAERQARQAIRKTKKAYPDKKIVVTGCAAQTSAVKFEAMNEVDLVIGNELKTSKDTYKKINEMISSKKKNFVTDIMNQKVENIDETITSFENRTRAFVKIQNGCNHRCTFCIIPYGRGNSRSVPSSAIISQIKTLNANGYNEVILTGVDTTSYGQDLDEDINLGLLCNRILKEVPELPRLRLSSIDVAEIDEELFRVITVEKRFMPHLHISLQSGNNLILKRMKRRHSREEVIDFCQKVRNIRPDVAFGSDIIAGFPTENEIMFNETRELLDSCNIIFNHIFSFSPRENTPASKMPQLDKAIIKERTKILINDHNERLKKFLTNKITKAYPGIIEANNKAKLEDFSSVIINNETPQEGSICQIKITGIHQNGKELLGIIV